MIICKRIIIGPDRRPETKQGIEGKIVRFRSGRVRDRVRDRVRVRDKDRLSEPDLRFEPNTVLCKNVHLPQWPAVYIRQVAE